MRAVAWVKLSSLPDQKLPCLEYANITYWQIRDGLVWHQNRKIRSADVDSFEVRSDDHWFIGRDHKTVYHAWSAVKKIDRDSFQILGNGYSRDATTGYYEFETSLNPLKGGSAGNFEVLGNGYARDSAFGYYFGRAIKSCLSPMTMQIVEEDPYYAMDSENVYFDGSRLKGVDRDSWKILEPGYSRDENRVYFGADKLSRVDPESWRHLVDNYSQDKQRVYCWDREIKGADLESWRPINRHYSTDGTSVFYFANVVEGADAASFKILKSGVVKDKHSRFESGSRVDS